MKPFLALTLGAFKRDFRDINTLVFSLVIPIAFIVLFGALFSNREPSKIELGISNLSDTEQSKSLVKTLEESQAFKIEYLSEDENKTKLDKGDLAMGLVIPKNFNATAETKIQVLSTAGRLQEANIGKQIISQVIDKQFNYVDIPVKVQIETKEINSKNLGALDFLIPGLIANSIMQLGIFGVAFAFVSQKTTGVLKRLLATPIKAYHIILAEGVESTILTVIQIGILLGIGAIFYKIQIVGNLFLFFFLALLGIIIFLAMGYAISGWAKNEKQVPAIANLISFPMLMLSGVFFSREIFPDWLQKITDFFPLTYLVDGMRKVLNEGATISALGIEFLGLGVWAVLSVFVAYKLFRWE